MNVNQVLTPELERRLEGDRRGAVQGLMKELDLDHLLLTGFDHIRYALNYRTQVVGEGYDWFVAVLDGDGTSTVFLPWVDEPGVEKTAGGDEINIRPLTSWAPAATHPDFWLEGVSGCLRNARRVGVDLLDLALLDGLRERFPSTQFVSVTAALYEMRKIKSHDEVLLLEASSQLNASAASHALAHARAGMTDYEVLSVSMQFMQLHGAEHLSHSLCNHERASGSWFAAGSILSEGDAYFFDTGCYGPGGYASDIARSGFIGEPKPEVANAWQGLLTAYGVAQELARPGARASEIHCGVNECLKKLNLPITPYGVGHGVGLRICELPTIHRADRMDLDAKLMEGQVIALEPETTVWVGSKRIVLKIEDNFVVQSDGCRLLSQAVSPE